MPTETEFFRWWIPDERTGKLRRTRHMMDHQTAEERHPGCKPDLASREVRTTYRPGERVPGNVKPVA